MDDAAALSSGPVRAEQAIFTSIRSPMGEGYRIVACSAGIGSDEKKELTRRSPSHDSLCAGDDESFGLASFCLESGRWCVAVSMHAGLEHTARGGKRVYTQIVVLEAADYERFACDPLAVQAEIVRVLGENAVLKQPSRLSALELRPAAVREELAESPRREHVERLMHVLAVLLCNKRVAISGGSAAVAFVGALYQGLPLALRRTLSLSVGLKYSPSRDYDLVLMSGDGDISRLHGDADRVMYDWNEAPPGGACPYDAWLGYLRRLWSCGRGSDAACLAARLTSAAPRELALIVGLCNDFERVAVADLDMVGRLQRRHAAEQPTMAVHADLLGQFRRAVEDRRALLEALAAQAELEVAGDHGDDTSIDLQKNGPPPTATRSMDRPPSRACDMDPG